jgi:D-alanine-D-alanine ligase
MADMRVRMPEPTDTDCGYFLPMRVAVVFDTPYAGWKPDRHAAQMAQEMATAEDREPDVEYQVGAALEKLGHEICLVGVNADLNELIPTLAEFKPNVCVNLVEELMGKPKLDYLVPSLLEAHGYPYTGSPPLALLVTRNKAMSKKILAYHGVQVPGFVTFRVGEKVPRELELRFPLMVKPLETDSSQGIALASVVQDRAALVERVAFVHERFSQTALVDEYVEGRELYATLLGNDDDTRMLPLVEMVFDASIAPEERFATQAAKWDPGYRERRGIKNQFARPISKKALAQLEETCRTAYRALFLRDYARLDVRLAADDQIWFIEANANPYLAEGHDSAESASKHGLDYPALIQHILDDAVKRDV